jgi:hypothetical protein
MSPRQVPARLGSEFDAFLFASIGEDRNGLSLSVVSALARMNLDPWQEAAALAALPSDAATQKVTALFAALPDESLSDPDRGALAARLIALLPRLTRTERNDALPHGGFRFSTSTIIVAVVLLLLAAQIVFAEQLSPTQTGASQTASTGTTG